MIHVTPVYRYHSIEFFNFITNEIKKIYAMISINWRYILIFICGTDATGTGAGKCQ